METGAAAVPHDHQANIEFAWASPQIQRAHLTCSCGWQASTIFADVDRYQALKRLADSQLNHLLANGQRP